MPVTDVPEVTTAGSVPVTTEMLVPVADLESVSVTSHDVPVVRPLRFQVSPLARFFCIGVPDEYPVANTGSPRKVHATEMGNGPYATAVPDWSTAAESTSLV